MWITQAATCHISEIRHIFKQKYMTMMITLFSLIIFHSHRCFQTYIYSLQDFLRHVINTATIRVLQKFHYNYHGDCRILADGMQICHLECHYHLTSILGRRPRSNYPRHSLECIYTTFFWTPTSFNFMRG